MMKYFKQNNGASYKGNKTIVTLADMCVASGDFTLAIFPGTKHKNCDIAAVKVIVEKSGGTVTDLFGNEQRYDESMIAMF